MLVLDAILNSGPPPIHLATGIPITVHQKAAILIPKTCNCTLKSISLYLNCALVRNTNISLDLHAEFNGGIGDSLVHGEYMLPNTKRLLAQWDLSYKLELKQYWFVVGGTASQFDHSFTWLDAQSFNATTAFWDGQWLVEGEHSKASTIIVSVDE